MYAMLLKEEGFDVRKASDVPKATELLLRENFDLVLLDIRMPGDGGKKMYEVIREYDPNLKVIVSSVYPVEEQIQSILGASAYHDKAQGIDDLMVKVKEVLEDKRVRPIET
ncbi:MAG: hypothetical protein AMJ95_05355 [Omnitrophica WOR_2 bacterium SM23_72]|nr:MAG: hypothetical protein AMJ95_05355 [Omnitrophica WOR_2 bacterium SM23_72]